MSNIQKFKDITINERNFRIKKFDARTGSYISVKAIRMIAPLFKSIDVKKIDLKKINLNEEVNAKNSLDIIKDLDISKIIEDLTSLPEQDFRYVQDECLKVCYEMLPAGTTPVLTRENTFGIAGIEDDLVLVLALTAHALIFNLSSFFIGTPLASLFKGILPTFQ